MFNNLFTFWRRYDRIYGMNELLEKLDEAYPDARCELNYGSVFELLISVILSAQCTDKRVNIVTEQLFKVADTPQEFCDLPIDELESLIKTCGLYRAKAANIKSCCRDLVDKFGGQVPSTMEELITLGGVGRKTANVMLSMAFDKPAIAVDTHVFRVSHRLGLASGNTPEQVEKELCARFDPSDYRRVHLLLINHGRNCCIARAPKCADCPTRELCKSAYIVAEN